MVLAALVYSDISILIRQKILVAMTEDLDEWYHFQSTQCRDLYSTKAFLVGQLAERQFFITLSNMFKKLRDLSTLTFLEFTLPLKACAFLFGFTNERVLAY